MPGLSYKQVHDSFLEHIKKLRWIYDPSRALSRSKKDPAKALELLDLQEQKRVEDEAKTTLM